jgi:hypothetical protein
MKTLVFSVTVFTALIGNAFLQWRSSAPGITSPQAGGHLTPTSYSFNCRLRTLDPQLNSDWLLLRVRIALRLAAYRQSFRFVAKLLQTHKEPPAPPHRINASIVRFEQPHRREVSFVSSEYASLLSSVRASMSSSCRKWLQDMLHHFQRECLVRLGVVHHQGL